MNKKVKIKNITQSGFPAKKDKEVFLNPQSDFETRIEEPLVLNKNKKYVLESMLRRYCFLKVLFDLLAFIALWGVYLIWSLNVTRTLKFESIFLYLATDSWHSNGHKLCYPISRFVLVIVWRIIHSKKWSRSFYCTFR